MSNMSPYWLGVLTTPAALVLFFALVMIRSAVRAYLDERWGITFEFRRTRGEGISDYTLRRDIWWERSFGPVFVGGWCYDLPKPGVNRWIGFGRSDGPHWVAYRKWKR